MEERDVLIGELLSKDALAHYGILGMHWGVRRYQNPDGTLTSAGKRHYSDDKRERSRLEERANIAGRYKTGVDRASIRVNKKLTKLKAKNEYDPTERRTRKIKKLTAESKYLEREKKGWDTQYQKEINDLKAHVKHMQKKYDYMNIKNVEERQIKVGKTQVDTVFRKSSHQFAAQYLFGIPGGLANGVASDYERRQYAKSVGKNTANKYYEYVDYMGKKKR